MAAEVPVTDVLCEAMEYLTKLGSNLRTRSENLKEKRINKEKLQNVHAVQKAAAKVLLICELSKKSLENVESGIRKVLSQVDASQASKDGGKILNSRKDVESKSDFRYFTYQSRKLKISRSKRVPLKHFMSAKVLAKSLPVSMQDKYPVYYDCKLYRMRKRKKSQAKRAYNDTDENISMKDKSTCLRDGNSDKECKINEIENKHTEAKDLKSNIEHTDSNEDNSFSSKDRSRGKSKNDKIEVPDNSKNTGKQMADKNDLCEESQKIDCELDLKRKSSNNSAKDKLDDSDSDSQLKNKSSKEQDVKKSQKRKFNKLKFIDDSSNSSKEFKQEYMSEKCVENKKKMDNASDSETSITSDHKPKKRKLIDSDSEEENIIHEPVISDNKPAETEKKDDDQSQETENELKKPLIKCVNITKLLKPDVLLSSDSSLTNKSGNGIQKGQETKSSIKSSRQQPSKDSKIKDYLIKESKRNREQEYWDKKRKEVAAFIPKNFVINITKLPNLSVNFLHKHNLKVITQNGAVLYKVANETHDMSYVNTMIDNTKNDSKFNTEKANENEDVNKVKNALLNDSDSDDKISNSDINKELSAEAEKVKSALLNDSDSDKNEKSDIDRYETSNLKSQHHSTDKISNDTEKVKDSLLKDTDTDNRNEVPDSVPKKDLEPQANANENLDSTSKLNPDLQPSNNILNEKSLHIDSVDSQNQSKECENTKTNSINVDIEKKPKDAVVTDKEVTPTKLKKDKSSESSDGIPRTPLSQRKKRKQSLTPQSKRKRIMESMHAKRMLLTYSSSSDTEDEQLKKALQDIKKSLLRGVSSDEEIGVNNMQRRISSSSSSSSDILRKVKKKDAHNSSNSTDSEKQKKEKEAISHTASSDEELKGKDCIEQRDGNMDEQSNSSSSKVGKL